MNKLITILAFLLLSSTAAFSAGKVGLKLGYGEIDANKKSYTAGGTTYAAQSAKEDSGVVAIFGEFDISPVQGLAVGLEYIPLEAQISLEGAKESSTSATVDNATTLYAMYKTPVGIFLKAGYFMADISKVKNPNTTTLANQSGELEGPMLGIGFETPELSNGVTLRLEGTRIDLDEVSITTTSNGSTAVKKKADGEINQIAFSVVKSF
jgi:hypothetical protein